MNAETLLLTYEERQSARDKGWDSLRGDWMVVAEETLCRRQTAKVLAYLIALAKYSGEHCGTEYLSAAALSRIIADTGLTWPPIEDFGTYGGVETLPPKEG